MPVKGLKISLGGYLMALKGLKMSLKILLNCNISIRLKGLRMLVTGLQM